MRIGELAREADVSVRVLRHYESQGLIESQRMANGYRDYARGSVEKVRWIRNLIDCGFSTRQIHGFSHCFGSESFDSVECATGLAQHQEKLRELDELIDVLSERRRRLSDRMTAMFGDPPPTTGKRDRKGIHEHVQG